MKNKILIIEDDLIIANDISCILNRNGFDTKIGIKNPCQAIEKLRQESYDLVLIDLHLSYNSKGTEIGNYLLENSSIPYIYITSTCSFSDIEKIKETRPHGIIFKPYKPFELLAVTNIIMNNKKHLNIDLFRNNNNNNNNITEVPFLLKPVIKFIRENIDTKIEIKTLANLTPWSYDHFIKNFSKYIGTTPYNYVLQKKIEKAKALIIESNYSVSEIAIMLSFESYSNFNNAFKKLIGFSPEQFSKQHKIINTYLTNFKD